MKRQFDDWFQGGSHIVIFVILIRYQSAEISAELEFMLTQPGDPSRGFRLHGRSH